MYCATARIRKSTKRRFTDVMDRADVLHGPLAAVFDSPAPQAEQTPSLSVSAADADPVSDMFAFASGDEARDAELVN